MRQEIKDTLSSNLGLVLGCLIEGSRGFPESTGESCHSPFKQATSFSFQILSRNYYLLSCHYISLYIFCATEIVIFKHLKSKCLGTRLTIRSVVHRKILEEYIQLRRSCTFVPWKRFDFKIFLYKRTVLLFLQYGRETLSPTLGKHINYSCLKATGSGNI